MQTVYIPLVEVVGNASFAYCANIKRIELGENVTSIENSAFYQVNTAYVIIRETTPPSLEASNFSGNTTFYVPDESVTAYREASGWSAYADRIKPLSEYVE